MAPTGTSTSLSHSSSSSSSASDNNNNFSRWSRRRRTPSPSEMTAANIGILLLLALFADFGTISNAELIHSHVFSSNSNNGQSRGLRLLDDAAREADQRPSHTSSPLSVQLLDSDENNKPLDDGGYNLVEPAEAVSDEAAAFEEGEEDRSAMPEADLPSLEFVQHHSVFINGGADGMVEAKDERDMVVVPMLMEPKRKKSVRRCGTVLLKHIQTVCGGCLRSPNPGGEVMLMSKRGSGESPLDVRNRLKRQAPGFNKITDICCTQRACGDEEVKPFCC